MFAGPNGSGKSVLKSYLPEPLLRVYLNPDEIEARVKECGYLDLQIFGVQSSAEVVIPFFTESEFLSRKGLLREVGDLTFAGGPASLPLWRDELLFGISGSGLSEAGTSQGQGHLYF